MGGSAVQGGGRRGTWEAVPYREEGGGGRGTWEAVPYREEGRGKHGRQYRIGKRGEGNMGVGQRTARTNFPSPISPS